MGDDALDCIAHRQRIYLCGGVGINVRSLFSTGSVSGFGAPLLILIGEGFLRISANAFAVPEFLGEINPFLVSIRTPGSTFKKGVDTGECPIQQGDQVVFEIDLQPDVLIILATANFEGLPNLINGSVAFKLSPTIKTVICNFHSV